MITIAVGANLLGPVLLVRAVSVLVGTSAVLASGLLGTGGGLVTEGLALVALLWCLLAFVFLHLETPEIKAEFVFKE